MRPRRCICGYESDVDVEQGDGYVYVLCSQPCTVVAVWDKNMTAAIEKWNLKIARLLVAPDLQIGGEDEREQ